MDLRKIKSLIDLVSESDISELEITENEGKVRIVKASSGLTHATLPIAMFGQPGQPLGIASGAHGNMFVPDSHAAIALAPALAPTLAPALASALEPGLVGATAAHAGVALHGQPSLHSPQGMHAPQGMQAAQGIQVAYGLQSSHGLQGAHSPAGSVAGADPADSAFVVKSPMVGTFYCASQPGADPFVQVGSTVSDTDVVCMIEAMKLLNEIEAGKAGTIKAVLVENGQPVEYGQPLFLID
jgi:acetyl-CoA carboxylase biotin carboxyl carrier protein